MLPDPGRPRELPDGDPVSLAELAGGWRVAPARPRPPRPVSAEPPHNLSVLTVGSARLPAWNN